MERRLNVSICALLDYSKHILTSKTSCFNSCPNDPQYASVLSNKQTYCANASIYSSSSSSAISKDWPTAATTTDASATNGGTAATKTSGSGAATGTASATGTAASASGSSGAEKAFAGAGGFLGLVAGVAAWLL